VLLDWLQEILEAAMKLTQSLENREDQDQRRYSWSCFCLSLRCRFPDSNILLLI
jgi:hypothetical protein